MQRRIRDRRTNDARHQLHRYRDVVAPAGLLRTYARYDSALAWRTKACRYSRHSAGSVGWPFPVLKYEYISQIKYTEAILSSSIRKLLWFLNYEKADYSSKNQLIVLFIIIFCTLSFPIGINAHRGICNGTASVGLLSVRQCRPGYCGFAAVGPAAGRYRSTAARLAGRRLAAVAPQRPGMARATLSAHVRSSVRTCLFII